MVTIFIRFSINFAFFKPSKGLQVRHKKSRTKMYLSFLFLCKHVVERGNYFQLNRSQTNPVPHMVNYSLIRAYDINLK